jgi:hypothetical protein
MHIKLINPISETCREIFSFEIYGNTIRHEGYAISFRDDVNDIWGDEFHDKFSGERKELDDKIRMSYDAEEDEGCSYEEVRNEYVHERQKYNPYIMKTKSGKPRYSAVYGRSIPKYPWEEETLKYMIVNAFNNQIKTMTIR